MSLEPLYDEDEVAALAQDLSESLILPTSDYSGYTQLARKLIAAGWHRDNPDSEERKWEALRSFRVDYPGRGDRP